MFLKQGAGIAASNSRRLISRHHGHPRKTELRVGTALAPITGSQVWTGEARLLVDKVDRAGNGSTIKVAMTTRSQSGGQCRRYID
jgi:hypothetical protein